MRKPVIFILTTILLVSFASAQLQISSSGADRQNKIINLNASTPGGSGGNSSFNTTYGNTQWWRLDGTNSPPTATWSMGGQGLTDVGQTNVTGYLNVKNNIQISNWSSDLRFCDRGLGEGGQQCGIIDYIDEMIFRFRSASDTIDPIEFNALYVNISGNNGEPGLYIGGGFIGWTNLFNKLLQGDTVFGPGGVQLYNSSFALNDVCLEDGTNCPSISSADGTGGWVNSSVDTNTTLNVNVNGNGFLRLSTLLYHNSSVANIRHIEIGTNSNATTSSATNIKPSIAIGENAFANAVIATGEAIAIGYNATATELGGGAQSNAVALGMQANATGDCISIGGRAVCGANQATAIGRLATATGVGSSAVGQNANTTAANSVAFGTNSKATGAAAFCLGNGAQCLAASGVGIGVSSMSLASQCFAFGQGAICGGDNSFSAGTNTLVYGNLSASYGTVNVIGTALENNTIINNIQIGNFLNSTANNSAFIGFGANQTAKYLWDVPNTLGTNLNLEVRGNTNITGNVTIKGTNLFINNATNSIMDRCTLVGGTCTINNNQVTANTNIFCFEQTSGGTIGSIGVSARTAGTSYTITSSNVLDTSVVACLLMQPI